MEKDFRYKLQHMGDSFVGLLQDVGGAAADGAAGVKDAFETWQVRGRQKKKIMELGRHAVRLRKEQPDLFEDEEILVVFKDYDELQDAIDGFVRKREERAARAKSRFFKEAGDKAKNAGKSGESQAPDEGMESAAT